MSTHDEIVAQMEIYVTENNKFVEKGIKSSATRARKALSEIAKLAKIPFSSKKMVKIVKHFVLIIQYPKNVNV